MKIKIQYKESTGIFTPHLWGLLLFLIGIPIFLISCGQGGSEADEQESAMDSGTGAVVLTRQQMEMAGFEFGKIEKEMLSGDVNARGRLMLPPDGQAAVSAMMPGVATTIEVFPGQAVQKGQVLAYLTHPDYIDLQEQYFSTMNSLSFLENEYNRQKRLYDENVSSEKKYLQAKTEFQGAQAKANALKLMVEELGLNPDEIEKGNFAGQIPVRTPIMGMVDEIMIRLGKNVQQGEPLFKITCRNKLLVRLDVFEKDILKIRKGQRVTFNLSNVDDDIYEAKVVSIGGSVQQPGRVIEVLASFENSGPNLFPGMFVGGIIHTGEEYFDALPSSAIMNYGTGNPYIYYTTSPQDDNSLSFNRAAVHTGFEEEGYLRVKLLEEIPENARIVTKGGYYIQAEEGEE